MFGYVLLALLAFLFTFVSEATFITFGGFLISVLFLGAAKFVKKGLPISKGIRLILTILVLIFLVLAQVGSRPPRLPTEMQFFVDRFPKALGPVPGELATKCLVL